MSAPPAPPKRPPGRGWYVVAGLLAVGSVAAAGIGLVVAFAGSEVSPQPFVAPEPVIVTAEAGQEHTIYLHARGGPAGDVATPSRELDCTVVHETSGSPVGVRTQTGFTLTLGADEYVSRFAFDPPEAGAYEVTCVHATEPDRPVPLAVGPRVQLLRAFGVVGGIFLGAFLGVVVAGIIAGVVAFRRSSYRRAVAPSRGSAPPPPPAP